MSDDPSAHSLEPTAPVVPPPGQPPPPSSPAEGTPEESAELRKQIQRFRRGGTDQTRSLLVKPKSTPPEGPPASADPPEAPDAKIALPAPGTPATEVLPDDGSPAFEPSIYATQPGAAEVVGMSLARRCLYGCLVVAFGLAAFLAGRYLAPAPVAPRKAPQAEPWTPADSAQLARALAADHAGDLATASRLTDDLAKRVPFGPALMAYQGTLHTRLGFFIDVESDLARSLGLDPTPETAATINTVRAFNNVRRRQFDSAIERFEDVATEDPFDAANFVHWGETLRRTGSLGDAADKFQQALALLPVTGSPDEEARREFISYERRLTLVENGREADLQPELDARLASPAPGGYWLLTAAAAALQKGDLPTAVDALTKARAVLPSAQLHALLDDYFFRSFGVHPEIKPFLTSSSPAEKQARQASMDYFIDP